MIAVPPFYGEPSSGHVSDIENGLTVTLTGGHIAYGIVGMVMYLTDEVVVDGTPLMNMRSL